MAVLKHKKYKVTTIVSDQYLKFGIYSSQLAKNALKFSIMVGQKFGIYSSQLAKNTLKFPDIFKFCTKTLQIILFIRQWLGKILKLRTVPRAGFKGFQGIFFLLKGNRTFSRAFKG